MVMDLSVCLVSTELFSWGMYGGFGFCTRKIGAALVKRGVRVSAVVPQGRGQKPVEDLEGMTVWGFPIYNYPFTGDLYRKCNPDIFHSEEPSMGSRVAMRAMPGRSHMVTCQNPKTEEDWNSVNRFYPIRRRAFNAFYRGRLAETVRRMDAVYCQARHIIPKVKTLYGLDREPGFLPNPVEVPPILPKKASEPTVCFLGRLDGEKRPELFFELARRFPGVRFIALGRAHSEARNRRLRREYGGIKNLELPGFTAGKEKDEALGMSWILVNTSVSECLPVSFLEAAAHGCAILSFHDPDGFASNFGYHVVDGDLDRGMRRLLEGDAWKEKGERGHAYVSEVHETGKAMDRHMEAYEGLLRGAR